MEKTSGWFGKYWHVVALFILVIVISYPVLFMEVAKGHDLEFHLMRIDGIMSDASWHNLPVRMQSKWLDNYGYPVSILYGDIFLYIGAVFRKLGLPIITAYRLFVVCINTATVMISYFSFRTFFRDRMISVISTALYTTAAYRLVDEYVRSAVGETLTIVFLPAIAAALYIIFTQKERSERLKGAVILALSVTSITCSHTITTSMLAITLPPVCIIGLFVFCDKGDRLRRFGDMAAAAGLFVLTAGFFLLPFLDFYLNSDIAFASDEKMSIQIHGVTLANLFDFFTDPFRARTSDIQRTPGTALVLVLICAIVYCLISALRKIRFENHKRLVFELCTGLILLFMSSCYFPWDFIEDHVPGGNIFTAIEFPMRYLAFVILLLTLVAGDLLTGLSGYVRDHNDKGIANNKLITCTVAVLAALCLFNVVNLCVYNQKYEKKARFMNEEDLGRWEYYAMDFQLKNSTVNDLDPGIKYEGLLSLELLSRSSNDFQIAVVSGPEYGWVQLPVFNYNYYYACDLEDASQVFEIHEGANRTVGVLLPGNYSGILHVYWKEPVSWKIAKYISLATFIGCMVFLAFGYGKRKFSWD